MPSTHKELSDWHAEPQQDEQQRAGEHADDIKVNIVVAQHSVAMRVPRATGRNRQPWIPGEDTGTKSSGDAEGMANSRRCEHIRSDADGFTLDDLDTASVEQYRQRFRACVKRHPWLILANKSYSTRGYRITEEQSREQDR